MLATQRVAPNSPQWFNTGLHWAYGIDGPGQGHFYVDPFTGKLTKSKSAYEHPQPHACFIQGVQDDLVNEGGIMDLWVREARLFKYGSGTGSNFSMLRGEGEKLSGGGRSSGLMSFLKIGDRAAGAIKSGGTTRRAAKMVIVDADHPDIEDFIDWKVKEEQKVASLVTGSKIVKQHLAADHEGLRQLRRPRRRLLRPAEEPGAEARDQGRQEERACRRTTSSASSSSPRQGYTSIDFKTYDTDWDSEAYLTVSGQNSNNSISLKDDFLRAVETDGDWNLTARKDGKVMKTLKARDLWEKIGYAAWASADPGLHFNTTMNDWHTSPAGGPIRGVQPVLGIHVPRRHGLQPRLDQPPALPQRGRHDRHRRLRAHRAPVDHRARNLGDDGAVPVEGDRQALLRVPHARPRLRQYRRPADDLRHPL